ncbi:MarR family winged helix-turn-helix transcriptional regulator [Pediococcus ethanolidurans]|uniref:Transcriptional regulator n=1 Tax=Pediococcus ethanolidurans TaxID=319653 RepID=A0A0R2K768_9LACO|nr:MarR family transcriptional regulator [Pediococcus ethanolidurans]KRN82116.1 transcriptional regulator [Pediococcus ethanolidurans]GEN95473.1 transcriptional regulator [Pediococcus ethanolidurans]SER72940.1 DNA-binding transcriptional regulator, MarR family [Pediococcus ethanolidurans]
MAKDSQELLNLFGHLFQQRFFVGAAIRSSQTEDSQESNQRGQLRVLRLLAQQEPLTNSQIVEKLDIRPSSASVLVSKLEEDGLVKKTNSPEDKRVTFISLTTEGRDAIEKSKKLKNDLSDSFFESLTNDEQEQLDGLLRKLLIDLENNAPKWDDKRKWSEFFNSSRGFSPLNHRKFPQGFNFHDEN